MLINVRGNDKHYSFSKFKKELAYIKKILLIMDALDCDIDFKTN